MGDVFEEQLIKRVAEPKYAFYIGACTFVTVAVAFASLLIHPILLVIAIVLGIGDYFLFQTFDVEYEYTYINGELDFDKIMAKSRRKRMLSVNVRKLEMIGPKGAYQLDSLRKSKYKTYNFSSNNEEHTIYEMYIREENELLKIYFEPNQNMLEAMRNLGPRKVIMN